MKQRLVVLDTNCLLQILGAHSQYRSVWVDFLSGKYILCVSNEILHEYEEILRQKAAPLVAELFLKVIAYSRNIMYKDPYFRFHLIEKDCDDNKFVDCAISCGADFIVTNDTHFDILSRIPFPEITIIPLGTFSLLLKKYDSNDNLR